jgi:hypothetical protein
MLSEISCPVFALAALREYFSRRSIPWERPEGTIKRRTVNWLDWHRGIFSGDICFFQSEKK